MMKYQLVLHFAAASKEDFDRLVALEDTLIGELDDLATVDGHDFGLGEFNIFILTDDPAESFNTAHRVVTKQGVSKRNAFSVPTSGWRGLCDPLAVVPEGI